MRNSNAFGFAGVFVAVVSLATVSLGDAPMTNPATVNPLVLRGYYARNVEAAKLDYEQAVEVAKNEFYQSILSADDAYMTGLKSAVQVAMKAGDLDAVEKLDQQMHDEAKARFTHQRKADRLAPLSILRAQWGIGGRMIDVTGKLRALVHSKAVGATAEVDDLGDPRPYAIKHLEIEATNGASTVQLTVWEHNPLPASLFPENDDPLRVVP